MSSHPLAPWLDLVRSALPAFKQLGADAPAVQAQWAQFIKSTLDMRKEMTALQNATQFALLQAQLGMLGTAAPLRTAQELFDVQMDAVNGLVAQSKALLDQAATRSGTCLADLRQAENQDDASFVMAGFLRDAESAMRKSAGETALLVTSAHAAADLLVHRMLDDLIADPAAAPAAPSAQP